MGPEIWYQSLSPHVQKISGICVCAGLGEIGPTLPGANNLLNLKDRWGPD